MRTGIRTCATPGCKNAARHQRTLCNTCRNRAYDRPIPRLFRNLKARGKRFALSLDFFTDLVLSTGYAYFHGREKCRLHVDRIDPRRGYEPDNVQILPADENARKRWEEYAPF